MRIFKIILFVLVFACPTLAYANATSFYFDPAWQTVMEGDIFTVDVTLNNADSTVFDSLFTWISYDTTYLEVQDADPGTAGVQIQSDPLGIFGFDQHWANNVDTTEGKIDLQESFLGGGTSDKSGAFATLTFKALGLASSTDLAFEFNTWGMTPTTALLRNMGDILGETTDHTDGTTNGSVGIIPEPTTLSLSLIGSALLSLLKVARKRK